MSAFETTIPGNSHGDDRNHRYLPIRYPRGARSTVDVACALFGGWVFSVRNEMEKVLKSSAKGISWYIC